MTYSWSDFSLKEALEGALVGFAGTEDSDISNTGRLTGRGPIYDLSFKGYRLKIDQTGKVRECVPENDDFETAMMVKTTMDEDDSIGTNVARTRGSTSQTAETNVAVISTMEPRDHFAMNILNAMLVHADHPETFDDATCIYYSRAAYRWAQAMMIAAADSRYTKENEPTTPQPTEVDPSTFTSNTEKLLYNLGMYIKEGVIMRGPTEEEDPQGEMPAVKIDLSDSTVAITNALDENEQAIPIQVETGSTGGTQQDPYYVAIAGTAGTTVNPYHVVVDELPAEETTPTETTP